MRPTEGAPIAGAVDGGEAFVAATVELDVFSGRPNPRWTLSAADASALRTRLAALSGPASQPPDVGLGYRGLIVAIDGRTLRVFAGSIQGTAPRLSLADANRALERWLLSLGKGAVDAGLLAEIEREVR
jgi:hypothetical protein